LFLPFLLALTLLSSAFSFAQEESGGTRKIISQITPAYPELARKMLISGKVKVAVMVAPSGKPKSVLVIGGNPVLAAAAVDALDKWKWVPAAQESKELVELNFHP